MKQILLHILLLGLFASCAAQKKGKQSTPSIPAIEQIYMEGLAKAQAGKLEEAIPLFKQVIQLDSNFANGYLSLAGVYSQQKNYELANKNYGIGIYKDTNRHNLYYLPYSINLAGAGRFDDALAAVNRYLSNPRLGENSRKAGEYRQRCYSFAVELASQSKSPVFQFNPVNAGAGINTREAEYFPSLTIDGAELVFTRRVGNANEDFYSSQRIDSSWGPSKPLPGNVNTPQNEGAQMISLDGQWLVFTGCSRPDGWGSCDIYISYLTPEGWSEAINLGGRVNSDQWDSQPCLSADKRELYFASRRFGGLGGSDLYVSRIQPDGTWGVPENLGPGINTAGDESTPFLHADNQTLYFTSNGLPGYGEDDIFMSRRGPKGVWSVPVNLGYPINTIDKEGSLFIAPDARTAYFTSDRVEGYGSLDIYWFELPEAVRPHKTLWVKGTVTDEKTSKGLPSVIELIDLSTRQTISRVQTNEKGDYLVTLPVGKDYAFNVNRKGYLFYSDNFFLKESEKDTAYEKNIRLRPIEKDAVIVLKNIFFDVNKFDLRAESQAELDKLVTLLKENPGLYIQINGHTDAVGNAASNQKLSENRAAAVVKYLVEQGIQATRLTYKGFGATQPLASNDTEEGKAQNRRTEMKVVRQ